MSIIPQWTAALAFLPLLLSASCTGFVQGIQGAEGDSAASAPAPTTDAGRPALPTAPPPGDLDVDRAQGRFVTTTDLMRLVIAPGCASEVNECHNSEDFPDLSSEGNLWNLVGLGCNQGIGERTELDGLCETTGDEVRITNGNNEGFTATIGAVVLVTNADEEFDHYELRIDRAVPDGQEGGDFVIVRGGTELPALGNGNSADTDSGGHWVRITDEDDIPLANAIRQGDENLDDAYGDGSGALVSAGDARASYLVMRLLGHGTDRVRMPLAANADNPTEVNPPLSRDEMYALMSWINCMEPGDGPYSEIRYECTENSDNRGEW